MHGPVFGRTRHEHDLAAHGEGKNRKYLPCYMHATFLSRSTRVPDDYVVRTS
jgi:hypothetical protein